MSKELTIVEFEECCGYLNIKDHQFSTETGELFLNKAQRSKIRKVTTQKTSNVHLFDEITDEMFFPYSADYFKWYLG